MNTGCTELIRTHAVTDRQGAPRMLIPRRPPASFGRRTLGGGRKRARRVGEHGPSRLANRVNISGDPPSRYLDLP